jgi:hypothetical protein
VAARISAVTALAVASVSAVALMLAARPALAAPGPGAYQAVLGAYERQGTVPACRFSVAELQAAQRGVDTYGAQYFADFTQAIAAALSARASGACSGSASVSAAAPARAGAGAGPGAPRQPARFGPLTAATSAGVPAPLAVMGALAAALALVGAVAGVARLLRRG